MKGKIKKGLLTVLASSAVCFAAAAAVACGDDGKATDGAAKKKSGLIGGFEQSESIDVELTNDASLIGKSNKDGAKYIYTSDMYPLNTIVGSSIGGVKYNTYQKLRLRRDFSYEYDLEITVRIVGDTNLNLVKLEATALGTFTYQAQENEPDKFTVNVSDPTSGTEKRYGAYITGENNIYSWKISSAPNYTFDIERALAEKSEGEVLDRYLRGRTVDVIKSGSERVLENNVFYFDFMNDVAPYCSYDSSSVPKDDEPDIPDPPTPPAPPTAATAPTAVEIGSEKNCGISLGMGSPLSIVLTYPDKTVKTATLDGVTREGKTVGENSVFEFDIGYADLAQSLSASVGGEQFTVKPAELITSSFSASDDLRERAKNSVRANALNVAAILGVSGVGLSDGMEEYIFPASQSVYQGAQWGKRDDMDKKDTDKKTADFSWTERIPALSIENGVAELGFKFKLNPDSHGKISAKIDVGGKISEGVLETVGSGDGEVTYCVKARVSSPAMFDKDVAVSVYDGENLMSTATHSVNRALAMAYLGNNGETLKKQSDALWSLAKSAAWLEGFDDIRYVYGFDADSCNYTFDCGEYGYTLSCTPPDYGAGVLGTRIYVGGKLVNDNSGEVRGENDTFVASRGAAESGKYPFTVTLDGANIDGISFADTSGGRSVITLDVQSDSTLSTVLTYNNVSGTINADCDVVISGKPGATLTVTGDISAKNLIIENVKVKVLTKGDVDGVSCDGLTIRNGGALDIEHVGGAANGKSAVSLRANASIDGELSVRGFGKGVYLCDGTAEQTFTVVGGKVNIEAALCGIDASDVFDDPKADTKHYLSRELYFNGGVTNISVMDSAAGVGGVSLCNITVGAGELYMDVAHGDGVVGKSSGFWNEWAGVWQSQSSLPTVIKTTGGSEKVGVLSIKVHGGSKIATVGEMTLNGGSVYLYGETEASGFVHTVKGTVMTLENCDVVFENGAGAKKSGRAILAGQGDEVFTVTNSAKLIFKNCDAPIACWGGSAKLVNDGLIILDTYSVGLTQWEVNSWEMSLHVQGNGEIRAVNKL